MLAIESVYHGVGVFCLNNLTLLQANKSFANYRTDKIRSGLQGAATFIVMKERQSFAIRQHENKPRARARTWISTDPSLTLDCLRMI